MFKSGQMLLISLILLMAGTVHAQELGMEMLRQQVEDTERAFAATMANRDFAAFSEFLSAEAVFFSGVNALRGKQAVEAAWKSYYEGPDAPFSWAPQQVEILESGTLALSTGPVYDPGGMLVSTFTSIWRLEAPGTWRIIFDKGNEVCAAPVPEEKVGEE